MSSLSQLKIPRKVLPTHLYDEAFLQVFCDASEKAYGACVCLVSVKDDIVSSTLISSKCKVAPIKPSTRTLGSSHGCQTCNSSQGGTIEHLCVVLRLNNCPLMDKGRPSSMAHICVKSCVPNSVNAPNN